MPDSNLLDNPTDFDLKSVIKRAFYTFSTDRLNFFNVTSLATSSLAFARFANVSRASALTLGRSESENVWDFSPEAGGGVLLGILRGGVPPDSSNPDSISDQKM